MMSQLARSSATRTLARTQTPALARAYSARPDLASGQRGDHAHGPVLGAHPSPEINIANTRSTIRVLIPSVSVMFAFMGWWFFVHEDRDARKETLNVGLDMDNKLKGSKHRAAQQLADGTRNSNGELVR